MTAKRKSTVHVTCTFEVSFPLPSGTTQTQARDFVANAIKFAAQEKEHDPMSYLDHTKVRVKLVRKTTFY